VEQFTEIRRASNGAEVAQLAAREIIETIEKALNENAVANVSLTGGTVGILTLTSLAEQPDLNRLDLSRVHLWWGDERYVASNSPDRNANQARTAFISKIEIPADNVHEFPATDSGLDLNAAGAEFRLEVKKHFGEGVPRFDLTILGMGPDGHVASLFPGHEDLAAGEIIVAEANSPKPPAERLSFGYEVLNASDKIIFVVSGLDKSDAVTQVHTNEICKLPAAKVQAIGETIWFVDQAAGAEFWSC
jgi:6-phosphogluconolactonase